MGTLSVQPLLLETEVNRHAYLLSEQETYILIDPGAKHHYAKLSKALTKHISIAQLDVIILQSNDLLNISSLSLLIEAGFSGTIIAKESGLAYLETVLDYPVKTIETIDYSYALTSGTTIQFIPTPFLPFPETFTTYIPSTRTLFTNHLMSQQPHEPGDLKSLSDHVHRFHESVLPSSDFVRQALKKLHSLKLNKLYPRLGYPILKDMIKPLIESVKRYDFYNTQQVILRKNDKNLKYNYPSICNHMLKRLESYFDRQEIIEVFKDSPIILEKAPYVEIVQTSLKDYKLWNTFFDLIYQKKGMTWLNLLAPLVKKYNRLYNINMPNIYKSKLTNQAQKLFKLDKEKTDLQAEIATLYETMAASADQLLRCPITKLYKESVLKQQLIGDVDTPLNQSDVRALIFVQIDKLNLINKKYGVKTGNETLRNLVYVIDQIKHDLTLVFKQDGPGLIIYKHTMPYDYVKAFALKLRNAVKDATVFVEPVSVSLSIVTQTEIDQDLSKQDKVNTFIETGAMRLEQAKMKGLAQLIDKDNAQDDHIEGNVLLIDEDETNQNLMKMMFRRANYECLIAKDIYDAYDIITNHPIEVIISEINLSKLDGLQLKQRLNDNPQFKDIPFIIASHHKTLDVIKRCNELDVDVVLKKPVVPEELIGFVNRLSERRLM